LYACYKSGYVNPNLNVSELLAQPEDRQSNGGYVHTLREILQQPSTWLDTCNRVLASAPAIAPLADGIACLALTGSGSSLYAGECVLPALRKECGVTAEAIAAGTLLTQGVDALPSGRPGLLISIARS